MRTSLIHSIFAVENGPKKSAFKNICLVYIDRWCFGEIMLKPYFSPGGLLNHTSDFNVRYRCQEIQVIRLSLRLLTW